MDATSKDEGTSGTQLSGAVYKKITQIDENISSQSMTDGCFTKGIPIMTREGWKRIEDIQVGDWVLSSPEDGSGKPEFKRVVRTFVFKDKTIREICYFDQDRQSTVVFATDNHPFWVEGVGWTRADLLKEGDLLRLKDGGTGKVIHQFPVYQFIHPMTGEPEAGVGWTQTSDPPLANPANGICFDYENYRAVSGSSNGEMDWEDMAEENLLKITVYNLEVEDFHTYYACRVWVHNADCVGGQASCGSRIGWDEAWRNPSMGKRKAMLKVAPGNTRLRSSV